MSRSDSDDRGPPSRLPANSVRVAPLRARGPGLCGRCGHALNGHWITPPEMMIRCGVGECACEFEVAPASRQEAAPDLPFAFARWRAIDHHAVVPDESTAGSADDSWDALRRYAEPIVAELDSPDETLLDLRVVIPGDDTVSCSAEFTQSASPQQRVALLRYAIKLIEDSAASTERFDGP